MKDLKTIHISDFTTESASFFDEIPLSYQLFGQELGSAPVVLVNHALTGNSNVCGENGWWKELIGIEKTIDLNVYTVVSFNIPGNGCDEFLIDEYKEFNTFDIAQLFLIGLEKLEIKQLFAIIGGSLGGAIAWEMTVIHPKITQHLIPIASDWKSSDWIIANTLIQSRILENSVDPIHDARLHAMLCYRTPASFKKRFNRSKVEETDVFNVESWLLHHGKSLQKRYQLSSYKLMNHLLKTIDVTRNGKHETTVLNTIEAKIHIICVDSDLFFTAEENLETYNYLVQNKRLVSYHEIKSIHGHDAFLIEFEQLQDIIKPIFNNRKKR